MHPPSAIGQAGSFGSCYDQDLSFHVLFFSGFTACISVSIPVFLHQAETTEMSKYHLFYFASIGADCTLCHNHCQPVVAGFSRWGKKQCVCLAFLQVFMQQHLALPAGTWVLSSRARLVESPFSTYCVIKRTYQSSHRSRFVPLKIEELRANSAVSSIITRALK